MLLTVASFRGRNVFFKNTNNLWRTHTLIRSPRICTNKECKQFLGTTAKRPVFSFFQKDSKVSPQTSETGLFRTIQAQFEWIWTWIKKKASVIYLTRHWIDSEPKKTLHRKTSIAEHNNQLKQMLNEFKYQCKLSYSHFSAMSSLFLFHSLKFI
jgi:hypothetical protein